MAPVEQAGLEKPAQEPSASAIAQTAPAGVAAPSQKVAIRMGLAPQTLEEAWRMAQFMAQSELVPKQYRGKPADVLVAIQYGMELGFPPMQALQSIAVINGRPSVWGDGFLALIMCSPLYQDHDEYYEVAGDRRDTVTGEDLKREDTTAVCTFWRHGKPQPVTRRFSVQQAKKATLWGKEGPWQTYPDRQMAMRARGFAGRDAFADLLRGIRTAEEALDTPPSADIDVAPIPPPVQPRRASEARADASSQQPAVAAATVSAESATNETSSPAHAERKKPDTLEIRGLVITHTGFVKPKTGEPYYEIMATAATGAVRTFLTRDESVYKEAASFEGTDHRVIVFCHQAKKDTTDVLVLNGLAIDDGAAPAADHGALFD